MDFLNAVLEDEVGEITDLEFSKNEHLGPSELGRNVDFDIFCRTRGGDRIIIQSRRDEMIIEKKKQQIKNPEGMIL